MTFGLIFFLGKLFMKLKSYQQIVDEIWLDKSGSEIKVIFRNARYRALRGRSTSDMLVTSTLINPDYDKQLLKGNIKV
jgi:hypothetical protein